MTSKNNVSQNRTHSKTFLIQSGFRNMGSPDEYAELVFIQRGGRVVRVRTTEANANRIERALVASGKDWQIRPSVAPAGLFNGRRGWKPVQVQPIGAELGLQAAA